MTDPKEPSISINGTTLTAAQAMTVRVATSCYMVEMTEVGCLGDDQNGESIRKGYLDRGREVMKLMVGGGA